MLKGSSRLGKIFSAFCSGKTGDPFGEEQGGPKASTQIEIAE